MIWQREFPDVGTVVELGQGSLDNLCIEPDDILLLDAGIGKKNLEIVKAKFMNKKRIIPVKGGEGVKSLANYGKIAKQLVNIGASRNSALFCIGGGATLDLGGFLAGTYHRGMHLINIPTTLLGMVDSAHGGKNGLNLRGKNVLGSFYMPRAVSCDIRFLDSLSKQQWDNGLAEIVKTGFVCNPEILDMLKDWPESLERVILQCIDEKMKVVALDPRDMNGTRATLNFGHTLGHALEFETGLPHGSAVGMGQRFAVMLSLDQGLIPQEDAKKALSMLDKWCPEVKLTGSEPKDTKIKDVKPKNAKPKVANPNRLLALMKRDKKAKDGLRFILLSGIGEPAFAAVDEPSVEKVLNEFLVRYG